MNARLPPAGGRRGVPGAETALDRYFRRIGHDGTRTVDAATLDAIVRAHVGSIPFENIDVQLGRRVTSDLPAIFDKLVTRRRGGWCYEQNGLIGWALAGMGFQVMRVAGAVMREAAGDTAIGNHLGLIVMLDRPWLVDVGFGGSLAAPIPLAEGWHGHVPFDLSLRRIDDGWWRFQEWITGAPFSWDFREVPADEVLIAQHLDALQTDPASPFMQNLVVRHRAGETHFTLRGRVLTRAGPRGEERQLLRDSDELVAALRNLFELDVPEVATLWPAIAKRHIALFGA